MKDPALLLYFDIYIASTSGMKAAFRGWYLDLLIYQYDKGSIPNDHDEMAGICRVRPSEYEDFKQMLKQVLEQKFQLNEENRYVNSFAAQILRKRENFKEKRVLSGTIGQIVKMAKEIKGFKNEYIDTLKNELFGLSVDEVSKYQNKQVLEQVLKQKGKLYINGDVNEDGDVNIIIDLPKKDKPKKNEIEIPTLEEFINYGHEKLVKIGKANPEDYTAELTLKYDAWKENGWKKQSGNELIPIVLWKGVLLNTLAHFKGKPQNGTSGRTPLTTMQHNIELSKQMGILKSQTYYEPIQIQITDEQD